MAQSFLNTGSRRLPRLGMMVASCGLSIYAAHHLSSRLIDTSMATGWSLFLMLVVLTLFNLRKKLPFFAIGRASSWLQLHVYLGLFTVFFLGVHVQFRVPTGWLESTMSLLFASVAASGAIGALLSRSFARRLATRGSEVIFERIPKLRYEIHEQAELMASEAVSGTGSTALADFYCERLAPFFRDAANFWDHLVESDRPRREMADAFKALNEYLNEHDREVSRKLERLSELKDDLDYHRALQGTLKGWLFLHVPATYALMLLALVHGILAHTFSGS